MPAASLRIAAAACAAALWLAACSGGGGGGGAEPPTVATQGTTRTLNVPSAQTGVTYEVTVYMPAGYAAGTDAKPVIYAPDRELQQGVLQDIVERYRLDAIVVSVGNLGGERRFIDFDLPGAEAYYRFVVLELLPRIEAEYRVDRSRRTLAGYSLSGLFAVIALMMEDPGTRYFSGYVITDPSMQFHTTELFAREQRLWDTTRDLPVSIQICYTINREPYELWPRTLAERGYRGLRLRHAFYPLSHGAVLLPCIDDGLRHVFGRG